MFLEIKNLQKRFGKELIVRDLNVSLQKHKTLSILGKSGCGKTTMLKLIAGLIELDSGEIILEGKNMQGIDPARRNTVYLYQEDLLFPHLNVFENIAFGLRVKKVSNQKVKDLVEEMIDNLELLCQAEKMPHQLSGGQRQRVSFGRAIITNPALLLLDEPFGSLDAGTRKTMQGLFMSLAKKFSITSIFVTHDLKEAILMGDEIAFMDKGNLSLYKDKASFIADAGTGVKEEIAFWSELDFEGKE
jgi:ABC-type sugar transport system ATPase subunit